MRYRLYHDNRKSQIFENSHKSAFAVIIPASIIGINFYEKNVSNPRIWENWTCDEMEQFALEDKDDNLNDYQASKFHEDLTECLGR